MLYQKTEWNDLFIFFSIWPFFSPKRLDLCLEPTAFSRCVLRTARWVPPMRQSWASCGWVKMDGMPRWERRKAVGSWRRTRKIIKWKRRKLVRKNSNLWIYKQLVRKGTGKLLFKKLWNWPKVTIFVGDREEMMKDLGFCSSQVLDLSKISQNSQFARDWSNTQKPLVMVHEDV